MQLDKMTVEEWFKDMEAKEIAPEPPDQQLMIDIVKETIRQRGQVYGDPSKSHTNIGLSWTGIIQQHYGLVLPHALPDYVVELMMVVLKLQRSCRVYKEDNYIDARAYLQFAEEDQKRCTGV